MKKKFINFNFFLIKLGAVLRSPNPLRANQSATLGDSSQRVRVFVHLTDDRVYSGSFHRCTGLFMPRWVLHRNLAYGSEGRVFIRRSGGKGVVSIIEPLGHLININDDIPEKHRCWLLTKGGTLLSADLRIYNHEPLPKTNHARCFVRTPDDNIVYVGELDYNRSRRPSWLV